MKISILSACLTMAAALLLSSCDQPACTNRNPVFDRFPPGSVEYRAELLNQLEKTDPVKLRFWFREYVDSGGSETLHFDVQGDNLCAVMVMQAEEGDKLSELRRRKGVSFRGAEFENLRYDIRRDSSGVHFILRDFGRIID